MTAPEGDEGLNRNDRDEKSGLVIQFRHLLDSGAGALPDQCVAPLMKRIVTAPVRASAEVGQKKAGVFPSGPIP
jgi:hypothetical protein